MSWVQYQSCHRYLLLGITLHSVILVRLTPINLIHPLSPSLEYDLGVGSWH